MTILAMVAVMRLMVWMTAVEKAMEVRVAQLRRRAAADRSISQHALEGISSWVLAVVIHLCRRSVCSSGHIAHHSLTVSTSCCCCVHSR